MVCKIAITYQLFNAEYSNDLESGQYGPLPLEGITLNAIEDFINQFGGREIFQNMTTRNVCEQIVKPNTLESKVSYVNYIKSMNFNMIAAANVFVIHSWNHNFLDFFDALTDILSGEESQAYLWIDIFTCNQHTRYDRDFMKWFNQFKPQIQNYRTICVLSYSDMFSALNRSWVLYELYSTVESNSSFFVAVSPTESNYIVECLQNDFSSFFAALGKVNISTSETANPGDRELILDIVKRKTPGYESFNEIILEHLRGWLVYYVQTLLETSQQGSLKIKLVQCKLYFAMGHTNEAEPMFVELINDMKVKLGQQHDSTLEAMQQLVDLYIMTIKFPHAEKLLLEIIQIQRVKYGSEDSKTIESVLKLANLLFNQQKLDDSEKYYREVLRAFKQSNRSTDDPLYFTCINNLASIYLYEGQKDKAEPLFVQSLMLMRSRLGTSHEDTISCMNHLATLYSVSSRFEEAEPLWKELVDIHTTLLGDSDVTTLDSMYHLGLTYKSLGKYLEAEPILAKCVEKQTSILGPNDLNTLNTVDLLCVIYEKLGDKRKAEPLYVQAINVRKATLGINHNDTIKAMNTFSAYLFKMEKYSKAESYYRDIYEARKNTLGDQNQDTIKSMHNLGLCLHKLGKNKEALPFFKSVHAFKKSTLGDSHPETVQALNFLNAISQRVA